MHNVNGRKKKRVEEEEKNSAVSADKASLVHFVIFPPPFPPLKIWRFVVVAFLFFFFGWMDCYFINLRSSTVDPLLRSHSWWWISSLDIKYVPHCNVNWYVIRTAPYILVAIRTAGRVITFSRSYWFLFLRRMYGAPRRSIHHQLRLYMHIVCRCACVVAIAMYTI